MEKMELKQLIKYNIEVYKDFDDFKKYTSFTLEEFNDLLEDGFFVDLTPCEGETILSVLKEEVLQDDFLDLEKQLNEDNPENQTDLKDVNNLVEDYVNFYKVFYIKDADRYFVDLD